MYLEDSLFLAFVIQIILNLNNILNAFLLDFRHDIRFNLL